MKINSKYTVLLVVKFLYFSRFFLSTLPSQALLLLLFFRRNVLPYKVWFYLILICFYWVIVLFFNSSKVPMQHMLFFFSFIPTFLVLISYDLRNIVKIFLGSFCLFIFFLTVIEVILVNTFLIDYLYFFPPASSSERALNFGFYQRPLGICGNASMSSCVLIFTSVLNDSYQKYFPGELSIFDKKINLSNNRSLNSLFNTRILLLVISIIILFSATGILLLLLYIFTKTIFYGKLNLTKIILIILSISLLISSIVLSSTVLDQNNIYNSNKFSLTYISYIFIYKFFLISSDTESTRSLLEALFGMQINSSTKVTTSGDFGFKVIYDAVGYFGLLLILIAPLLYIKSIKYFIIPMIFFILSFVHYPGLLSGPGSILFGTFLYILHRKHKSLKNRAFTT